MAYNTPETVADYLARFQMEITHRGKGTFTPDHVKYSLTIASGGKDFFTTFESNPHVESVADDILDGLSYDGDYVQTDEAKDTIISAIYATFEEKYGEDFADCADNFIQDNDDIAGRVNPCAMSVETVRAVYGMGFDAVFLNDWKKELAECDIDPEAVSVDSEAHDMENGRDGLDGNAPEKDTPEKDDRDAQPPVDTDNR